MVARITTPVFAMEEGIFSPRDETYNFRPVSFHPTAKEAKKAAKGYSAARVVKLEIVWQRTLA